jgi:hypothetical protein
MSDQKDPVNTGVEVQIMPKKGATVHSAGALYDLLAPPATAPVNENDWNEFHIICNGPVISCKMNGVETFRIDLRDEKWKKPQGKFKLAYVNLPRKGWIMLQDHGDPVAFRHIRIKPLPAPNLR